MYDEFSSTKNDIQGSFFIFNVVLYTYILIKLLRLFYQFEMLLVTSFFICLFFFYFYYTLTISRIVQFKILSIYNYRSLVIQLNLISFSLIVFMYKERIFVCIYKLLSNCLKYSLVVSHFFDVEIKMMNL